MNTTYDCIIIGAGAAGMLAAISAAKENKKVLVLEKLPKIAAKLKATGGGRCNLTNTLSNDEFMAKFGRDGRFMTPALNAFNHKELQNFFSSIGVETHAPDGFRIFPIGHNAMSVINGLAEEMEKLNVSVLCSQKVKKLICRDDTIEGVETEESSFFAPNVIMATGGMGYPVLGAEGDGFVMAKSIGHKVTDLHPAMMPLKTKELWEQTVEQTPLQK